MGRIQSQFSFLKQFCLRGWDYLHSTLSNTHLRIQFLVVLHHFHHLRHSSRRIENWQQQHILVVLKQPRILKNRIIGVDGWNRVDVQKQVRRSEDALNSNVTKSVRWIDAIHIVHSLSLSCYIWDV